MDTNKREQEKRKLSELKTFPVPFALEVKKENITNNVPCQEQIINQAIQFHLNGNIEKASKYYQKLINQGCKDHRVFSNYGVILKNLGEFKKAEIYTRKAIEINPDWVDAHYNLGVILEDIGKLHEAELSIRKVIELSPDLSQAHLNLGVILRNLGQLQKAEISIRKAIEINPDYAKAYYNLGIVLKDVGKLQEAELSLKKTSELKSNWEADFLYASILFDKNQFDSSLETLQKAKVIATQDNLAIVEAAIKVITKSRNESINKDKLYYSKASKESNNGNFNRIILQLPVENELISYLYTLKSNKLSDTKSKDARFGDGLCSDFYLFKDKSSILKKLEINLKEISKKALGKKEIFFADSFFNIFTSGSGATPHNHISPHDVNFGLSLQKYSLVYYLETGDQTSSDPGILKLYNPDEEILPVNGMIVIMKCDKFHSVSYSGNKDRVMVGVNFYGF